MIPAMAVMAIDWHNNRQQLGVLQGPGLSEAFDASLELARMVLNEEKNKALEFTEYWSDLDPYLQEDFPKRWWKIRETTPGHWEVQDSHEGKETHSFSPWLIYLQRNTGVPRRLNHESRDFLLTGVPGQSPNNIWFFTEYPLSRQLVVLWDDIERGGAGVRQLSQFYSRLLRSNVLLTFGVLTFVLFLVSLFLSHLLARYLARPLKELSYGTERIAAGELDYQVQVQAPAEMGRLVVAFNRMSEQLLQGKADLQRAERVAAWQGVARRLAHEIKNPLTPITLAMHRIGKKSDDKTIVACVETVLEEASNLGRLADEFSNYAQLPTPQPARFNATQYKELLESLAHFYLERTNVEFGWLGWDRDFELWVDAGQLRQVMGNLIKNGNEAMQGKGSFVFELETVSAAGRTSLLDPNGLWIRCTFRDSGPGLKSDPEDVFEPYATTKATGTGLGLAVSRRMIEDLGGCLWASTSADGAAFVIDLPEVSGLSDSDLFLPKRNQQ